MPYPAPGSDKRGTIYGVYDISEMIGVSPWYWWADAVPGHRDHLRIDGARYVQPSPKVKYRGLFINDEEPSFGSWSRIHFGGYNSKMYTRLFELILRLKANYLWPAMWNARFNEDDSLNPRRGLRVAVSVDGGEPRVIDARRGLVDTFDEYSPKHLKLSHALKPLPPHNRDLYLTGGGKHMRNEVFDNIRWLDDTFDVDGSSGRHIVRVYLVDPEIVLERVIVNPDNDRPSYFGRWTE